MLIEIQKAVEGALNQARLGLQAVKGRKMDPLNSFPTPSVIVAIYEINHEEITQTSFWEIPTISVLLFLKNQKLEDLLLGGYPIIEGVRALLQGRRFGLKIQRLKPTGVSKISSKQTEEANIAIMKMDFTTKYSVEAFDETDDATAKNLISSGIGYYANSNELINISTIFSGSGLNDLSVHVSETEIIEADFFIKMSTFSPDAVVFSFDGGATYTETPVEITGEDQTISQVPGISFKFSADNGHTVDDVWQVSTCVAKDEVTIS